MAGTPYWEEPFLPTVDGVVAVYRDKNGAVKATIKATPDEHRFALYIGSGTSVDELQCYRLTILLAQKRAAELLAKTEA